MINATRNGLWVVRLVDGEDLAAILAALPIEAGIIVAGIGMLRDVELGYWNGSAYETHSIDEPVELVSAQGNIAVADGERVAHCHLGIAHRDGSAAGGHLISATAHNTVELFLQETPGITLRRTPEPSGLLGLTPSTD
jgi:predicted DNA-binding protein with PD1-like motif